MQRFAVLLYRTMFLRAIFHVVGNWNSAFSSTVTENLCLAAHSYIIKIVLFVGIVHKYFQAHMVPRNLAFQYYENCILNTIAS